MMILRSLIAAVTVLGTTLVAGTAITQDALPHHDEIAPGMHAAGFADRYRSANCGWVELGSSTLLVDLPPGIAAAAYLAEIKRSSKKPATALVLTHAMAADLPAGRGVFKRGVKRVYLSPATYRSLSSTTQKSPATVGAVAAGFEILASTTPVGDEHTPVEFQPHDESCRRWRRDCLPATAEAIVRRPARRERTAGGAGRD